MNPVLNIFFYYTRTNSIRMRLPSKVILGLMSLGVVACSVWSALWLIQQ